ncbi:hypothetical protein HMPREF3193_01401 [Bifidobacterium breve]|nr:hypothetical protein HMPREF1587_01383 [Bifidobacterium breve JCP7499]KWZ84640.1 hypothetical protein HMPREF3193_01401 [Bifidobacterium breve]
MMKSTRRAAPVAAALPIMPIMRTVRLGVVLWLMTMMSRARCAVAVRCPMISRKTMSVRFAVVALHPMILMKITIVWCVAVVL